MRPRPIVWIGGGRDNVKAFPEPVRKGVGYALWFAQTGGKHPHAKSLRGFGGAGVLEIFEDFEGNTYRAVYTVSFAEFVYVLHCFQKKAKRGAQTPKADVALIKSRFRAAEADYEARREGD